MHVQRADQVVPGVLQDELKSKNEYKEWIDLDFDFKIHLVSIKMVEIWASY